MAHSARSGVQQKGGMGEWGDGGGGGAASPAPLLCYNMYSVAYGKCWNYHFECCCFLKIVIMNKGKARNVYSGIGLVYSLNNRDLNVIMATLLFSSTQTQVHFYLVEDGNFPNEKPISVCSCTQVLIFYYFNSFVKGCFDTYTRTQTSRGLLIDRGTLAA